MSVSVLNTTSSLSGKTLAKLEDSQTFTGAKTFDRGASAPFICVSGAAKVDYLDADKLDGETGADYHAAANLTGQVAIANGGTGAATAAANLAFIGPASGGAAAPSLRALVAADVATEQTTTATGGQNDFAPSAGALVVILCTGAAPSFTGFTGGAAGRRLRLICKGTTLKVVDEATSTAANQIKCQTTVGLIVGVNGIIDLTYDAVASRWKAAILDAGSPIAFTPTWTGTGSNPAIGDGTLTGKYRQRGKTVWFEVRVVAGGTTTFGTGTYSWALPLTAAAANRSTAFGYVEDTGTSRYVCVAAMGTATFNLNFDGTNNQATSAVPMTWASTDTLTLQGEYELP